MNTPNLTQNHQEKNQKTARRQKFLAATVGTALFALGAFSGCQSPTKAAATDADLPERWDLSIDRIQGIYTRDRSRVSDEEAATLSKWAVQRGEPRDWETAVPYALSIRTTRLHPESAAEVARIQITLGLLTENERLIEAGIVNLRFALPLLRRIVYEEEAMLLRIAAARTGAKAPLDLPMDRFSRAIGSDSGNRERSPSTVPGFQLAAMGNGEGAPADAERNLQSLALGFLTAWVKDTDPERTDSSHRRLLVATRLASLQGVEVPVINSARSLEPNPLAIDLLFEIVDNRR